MKKTITLIAVFSAGFISLKAQSLLSKVPSNASLVVKYSGDNFSKNVPLKKLDSYNFVKNNLYKALKIDSLTALENTGINFEQDAYQYVTMDDSSINFTSLFVLKNVQQFLQLVQANYHAEMKPEKKNGFEFLGLSDDLYIGWNDKQGVLVYSGYQNKKGYYDYEAPASGSVVYADSTMPAPFAVDTTIRFTPPVIKKDEEVLDEEVIEKDKPVIKKNQPAKKKRGVTKRPGKATAKSKKGKGKKTAPVIKDEEVMPDEKIEEIVEDTYHYDTTGQAAREAWLKEQDKYAATVQKKTADSIITLVFTGNATSMETEQGYKKVIDPAANVSVWVNYDNLMFNYWRYIFGMRHYSPRRYYDMGLENNLRKNDNKGFRTGMSIFFEKDKMRLEQKMYSPDEQTSALGREMYNSKQSTSLAGYINPNSLAYVSASINTEALTNYYYKLIRQYLNSTPFTNKYSDIVDVYMDLIEIIVDEKAIAELMPGNMVMVLHDMKTKMVTYTDYTYDDNFKATEVKKQKQELSPDFSFIMETKKEAFMKKIANLPLKYAEKEKFNYKEKGGYYELAFDADKYPISSLYFMIKDGKAIVTTSKEVIDMTLNNTSYTLDAATKNSILNNNVVMRIDTKKMLQQITPELSSESAKKISKYFEENMGDVKSEGGIKDGMMYGTTTMNITGNHTNSLEFFFNMIEAMSDIIEKDKLEKNKKVD